MTRASCLCGSVAWEFDEPFEFMVHCHCSRCRKAHGVNFATYVGAPAGGFCLRGAEHVVRWESSPGTIRTFCGQCGSVVPSEPVDGRVIAPAGNFDDDPEIRPQAHIFVASKAPWYEICDSLPQFHAYPPNIDAPVLPDRPPLDAPGHPRASCLCGGVAFTVESKALRHYSCHCSRCRKARSAAHGSNFFTPADGVRFTRGEDLVVVYKLPEAQYFAQAFCRVCGSAMPRIDRSRDLAVVPLGPFDDDPGIPPLPHIYVASKAPWFDIADDRPQYPEGSE